MADKQSSQNSTQAQHSQSDLVAIKERLRKGKLTQEDVRRLEKLVVSAEEAARALRAAVVE